MNLKVPGAILPLDCATVQPPLGELGLIGNVCRKKAHIDEENKLQSKK